jgi:hypothetical protein
MQDVRTKTKKSSKRNLASRGGAMNVDVNPPRGQKGDFRKVSITVPPSTYEQLVHESARRKIAGEPNQLLSALIREAVVQYLERLEQ